MKLSIPRPELQRGLSRIQAIVEKRNSMPILANALLKATKTERAGLEIAATDLEVGIRGTHAADVSKAGSITVSARKLFEIVRELADDAVVLAATPNSYLEIHCGRSRFTLAGTAAEEFPTLPEVSPSALVRLPAAVVSSLIERTMYAASVDETRYNLNGVYFELTEDRARIRMVATDGHRLALVDRLLAGGGADLSSGVILPRKGLAEVKRLVDEEDADEIEFGIEGNSALARKGDVTLTMRLIEGEFPNYRQVLPKASSRRITLSADTLNQALRRVALLSIERSKAVRVELAPGCLRLSANNPDLGEASEELDIDYAGEAISVGFNARYLLDSLAAFRTKEVELGLEDEMSPAVLRPTDDSETLAVVMPMRL
jgi:DNA polymerase-3 subunit beta